VFIFTSVFLKLQLLFGILAINNSKNYINGFSINKVKTAFIEGIG